jgi:hypothetical protein
MLRWLINIITGWIDWLLTPAPCEDCGAAVSKFRPGEEQFLCDRCAGAVK